MKLYLASANNKQDISLFEEYKCLYMLNTFYDLMKMNDKTIERILSIPEEFILDSGAFTFMNTGKKVDWKQYIECYCDFINKWNIKQFIELDLYGILGVENTEKIRKYIEQRTGKKPIPVYHGTLPVSYFRKLCNEYPYIALSATGRLKSSKWTNNKKVLKQMLKIAHSYGTKVHGLGYTKLTNLNTQEVPFYSVDSTSWLSGARFGRVYVLDKNKNIKFSDIKNVDAKRMELNKKNLKVWIEKQKQLSNN